ncbi:hypothetical protein F2Q68_00013677 [Brassica cretica]|uniref:AT-hook motif nuclear-localized protein n=1 Tax=Brassica cretica TaxID=69181 RepID=A0A8S9HKM6_BRACR|nr:hypothetical protein F2Q68_00013677 [Brassica cretica]
MDSNETHQQQQNRNAAAALAGPTAPSQAMHNRSSVGALSLLQPQPLQGVMLDGSPYSVSVATQRGRGRPRKYAPPDVNVIDGGGANAGPPAKRKGRPLGSRTKQPRKASGGGPLTAHVINVNAGEDIAMKLVAFVNQEPRDVCILSVSGAFVGGMLVAGSQVQVIVGTFEPERVKLRAALESADVLNSNGGGGPGLPQSQGPSESSEENASKSLGNSTPQPPHHLPL